MTMDRIHIDHTIHDLNTRCVNPEHNVFIEGGDVVQFDNTIFIGISDRTNAAGAELMQNILLRYKPDLVTHVLVLTSSTYYHLDTCFLPSSHFVILAQPLETLFDTPSIILLRSLFSWFIIASELTRTPWKWCNGRSYPDHLLLSCSVDPVLRNEIARFDPLLQVSGADLTEIAIGGGGLSCVSLGTSDRRDPVFLVHPSHCDLTQYQLNPFQKQGHRSHHAQHLVQDMNNVIQLYQHIGSQIVMLPSASHVPECIFVKDLGVLLRSNDGTLVLILCSLKTPVRRAETQWLLDHIIAINHINNHHDAA